MRLLALAFAALALTAFVGVWALILASGMGHVGPWELFLDSALIEKLADVLLVLGLAGIAISWLGRMRSSRRAAAQPPVGWAAFAVGALVALERTLRAWIEARLVHVTDFRVIAPSLAEALMPLGIGLLCAALCFGLAFPRRATAEQRAA